MKPHLKFILIGPAPHILEKKLHITDDWLVCRVGNVFPLSPEMIEATGRRCDYWYPNNLLLKAHPEICLDSDIRKIRITKTGSQFIPKQAKHKWERAWWNLPVLMKELGCMPNRGLRAMIDILSYKPQLLYITGFTFYQGEPYYPGYTTEEHYQHTKEMQGDISDHRQKPQIEFFRRVILPNPAVKVDKKLKEMFV